MEIRLVNVYRGSAKAVVALALDSRCHAQEFLEKCKSNNEKDFNRLFSRIQAVADTPSFRNNAIFRPERDQIFTFVVNCGWRLYCFFDKGNLIIVTNGGTKNGPKEQTHDIDKAVKLQEAYFLAKKQGVKIQTVEKI